MIFDQAAGIIERHIPAVIKRMEQARVFLFDARAQDVLPKHSDVETVAMLHEHFFLPFPTMAVEDKATCTVLWDTEKDQEGLSGERGFLEIEPIDAWHVDAFVEGDDPEEAAAIKKVIEGYPEGSVLISEGRFGPVKLNPEGPIDFMGMVLWSALATKADGIIGVDIASRPKDQESLKLMTPPILRNVNVGLQEVFYFNSPNRFIVEDSPLKAAERHRKRQARKGKHKERIRRRHDRPTYTLLRPSEIRKRLNLPPLEAHGPKRPHERRRHSRTYRDGRYKAMKGKTVMIPATWVGDSEAVIGNHRYRILLDR
jgi:hypothetical protein